MSGEGPATSTEPRPRASLSPRRAARQRQQQLQSVSETASLSESSFATLGASLNAALMLPPTKPVERGILPRAATSIGLGLGAVGRAKSGSSSFHPASPSSKRASDSNRPNSQAFDIASLVIPGSFFQEVAQEAASQGGRPRLCNRLDEVAGRGGAGSLSKGETSWRRKLVSPLVGFLNDLKSNTEFIQLSGHEDHFLPGRGGTLFKKSCDNEREAYEKLMEAGEPLRDFVPLYYKEVNVSADEKYLKLRDLLSSFTNPSVMDVKMGVRTFLESEVSKTKRRLDLLAKMVKLEPDEPTAEEKEHGITKLRYMTFREKLSSSRNLGFRIEGIKLCGHEANNNFKTVQSYEDVSQIIRTKFLPPESKRRAKVTTDFYNRLIDLQDVLGDSKVFATHGFIGSSLLFVYDDDGNSGVWLIDFGKTQEVDLPIKHNVQWELGNQEDGYLIGLETLLGIMGGRDHGSVDAGGGDDDSSSTGSDELHL